jgi:hypothetical protein
MSELPFEGRLELYMFLENFPPLGRFGLSLAGNIARKAAKNPGRIGLATLNLMCYNNNQCKRA